MVTAKSTGLKQQQLRRWCGTLRGGHCMVKTLSTPGTPSLYTCNTCNTPATTTSLYRTGVWNSLKRQNMVLASFNEPCHNICSNRLIFLSWVFTQKLIVSVIHFVNSRVSVTDLGSVRLVDLPMLDNVYFI